MELQEVRPLLPASITSHQPAESALFRCWTARATARTCGDKPGWPELAALRMPPRVSTLTTDSKVAIGCGSGGSLLGAAIQEGCDLFLSGGHFPYLLGGSSGWRMLLLLGHFASERFRCDCCGCNVDFRNTCWASDREVDPVLQFN